MNAPQDSARRLSPLDGSFLRLETGQSHMHVGWSAIFEAPAGRPRPSVQELRERAGRRLHEVPWCRWRLENAPLGLSEPRWVEDPAFDIGAHIVELTSPADRVSLESFEALRSALMSAPLDRSRPLWQVFVVPRLEDDRVGMIGKIHHALVDGIAALQIVALIIDRDDEPALPARPARSSPLPLGPVGWALDTVSHAVGDSLALLRAGAVAAARPRDTASLFAREARRVLQAVVDDVLPPAPRSALNAPIGARRTLVGYHARRDDLRAARRSGGGTLNDIGLTVVAGALRALAVRRGAPPAEPLKTMVPVNMRRANEHQAGNRIAMVYMPLPVHLATPRERLAWVREQTDVLKHTDRADATQTLYGALGQVPPPLRTPVVRALATPRQFNLTVSQSPAPRGSLYLFGLELEEVYSVVPIAQGHALAIGMVRYRNELFFGCYADPDALPEVTLLPALLEAELHALAETPAAEAEDDASVQRSNGRATVGV